MSKYHKRIVNQLVTLYPHEEAQALARWIWEDILFVDKHSHFVKKERVLTPEEIGQVDQCVERLLQGEPIQHIVGYGYFYGRKFSVSPHVLIPRQETEELMVWIRDKHLGSSALRVLDIGTGTGCIPISLDLEWRERGQAATLMGMDISPPALEIAQKNASELGASVRWIHQDIFQGQMDQFGDLDILISNPPYIPEQEKETLFFNVRDRDPDLALFVPQDDPLLFYSQIAQLGLTWLKPGGSLYVEVHSDFGEAVKTLLNSLGYTSVVLKKDLNQRDRMIQALIP